MTWMHQTSLLIWESSQSWAPALLQLSGGRIRCTVGRDYDEIRRLATQCPYAVLLWEVNLTNWEDRVVRLREFLRERTSPAVAIAAENLPPLVVELFLETGALIILHDRLDGLVLLRIIERQCPPEQTSMFEWRDLVEIQIPWLVHHP